MISIENSTVMDCYSFPILASSHFDSAYSEFGYLPADQVLFAVDTFDYSRVRKVVPVWIVAVAAAVVVADWMSFVFDIVVAVGEALGFLVRRPWIGSVVAVVVDSVFVALIGNSELDHFVAVAVEPVLVAEPAAVLVADYHFAVVVSVSIRPS